MSKKEETVREWFWLGVELFQLEQPEKNFYSIPPEERMDYYRRAKDIQQSEV